MTQRPPYGEPYDCEPTLTDRDVINFCRNGYLVLEGVVPDEINREIVRYLDEVDDSYEPTPIVGQEWFLEGVLKNPQAAGAVRSLLGRDFALPVIISNHRGALPGAAQGWHRDGQSWCPDHRPVWSHALRCRRCGRETVALRDDGTCYAAGCVG